MMKSFQMASLVAAPIDRNLGNGMGLVQVGVVDRKYKRMAGQWGGSYLAEKGDEVAEDEDEESADEEE